jgi:AraC family transcriptional regulator, transcriptional activator of pobA
MASDLTQYVDIPEFFLFGEAPKTVGHHYLHLEPLSDRSRPNNWNIRPHSHTSLSHIFHLTSGSGTMRAEDRTYSFAAPCALLVPAGVVHGFQFAPESEGTVLTISKAYLQELSLREGAFGALFVSPAAVPLSVTIIQSSLKRLAQELSWIAAGHDAAVEAHLLCILVACVRALEQARSADIVKPGAQATLVARFREAIERHYRRNLPLARYTAMLGVTERQLRSACLKVAGMPPTGLIQMRILLEAKRALLYSNMTVSEATYYLGFNDPGVFFPLLSARHRALTPRLSQSRRLKDRFPIIFDCPRSQNSYEFDGISRRSFPRLPIAYATSVNRWFLGSKPLAARKGAIRRKQTKADSR